MLGLSGLVTSVLGVGTFPSLINWLIPIYGWRTTYVLLGLSLLFFLVPLSLIFMRNRPEEHGLNPDGASVSVNEANAASGRPLETNWTLSEAIRTSTFWIISAGMASVSMLNTGLTFHLFSIFSDNGLSATVAASVFLPMAATTAIVQMGGGLLSDRIPVRVLLAVALFQRGLDGQQLPSFALGQVYGQLKG